MKKSWNHINFEQRKTIASGLAHNYKILDIANLLGIDPTSISKEVKRNRDIIVVSNSISNCKRTQRWPYVCSGCTKRYRSCPFTKYKYNAKSAQTKADFKLLDSRRGIDVDAEEFRQLDDIIKKGVSEKKSIYQIKIQNNETIKKSVTTIYRYINNMNLGTSIGS